MIRGFSTKKIRSQKTFGEILKSARIKKNISLDEAEIATKIRAKYLVAIEDANWSILPQDVYLRGFILAYAKFLGLDSKKILKLYEEESGIRLADKSNTKFAYDQQLRQTKMLITPKTFAYLGLAVFVVAMFSYIIFQVVNFAGNPNLKVLSPANNIILETDSTELSGITDTDTMVAVNNENVPVTSDGRFYLKLKLHQGVNIINVKAINKLKKESSEVFTIEYKPKTASLDNNLN